MIGVQPLETRVHFELNKQISCSIQVANGTDDYFAFSVSRCSLRPYNIYPSTGIVRPRSNFSIIIALQPLKKAPVEEQCKDEFTVQSTRVEECLEATDITGDIFHEGPGRVVDQVDFTVVLVVPPLSGDW
ncbi:hypothetical protein QOZ80_5BG0439740 [Eleusine coracana subsp. coracana]|nr:hypothetical protein QOZ80_5BG0439740 [Eleusine coracana subsp. coracana]